MAGHKKSVIEHLEELRSRVIVILVFFGAFSVLGFIYSSPIVEFIQEDLFQEGVGVELIVTHPMDFLIMKINIAIFIGIVLASPVMLYQFLSFVRPALSRNERKYLIGGVLSGVLLFLVGVLFAYNVLVRFTVWFLANLSTYAGVLNLWNINEFFSFVLFASIMVGLLFELPLVSFVLAKMGVITKEAMKEQRAYFIVAMFILAAILTPPDPFTQVIIALPMVLLYEVSILIVRFFG